MHAYKTVENRCKRATVRFDDLSSSPQVLMQPSCAASYDRKCFALPSRAGLRRGFVGFGLDYAIVAPVPFASRHGSTKSLHRHCTGTGTGAGTATARHCLGIANTAMLTGAVRSVSTSQRVQNAGRVSPHSCSRSWSGPESSFLPVSSLWEYRPSLAGRTWRYRHTPAAARRWLTCSRCWSPSTAPCQHASCLCWPRRELAVQVTREHSD